MNEDIVRVLRIVEITGPRSKVEEQVRQSLHGIRKYHDLQITSVTLTEYPEILEQAQTVIDPTSLEGDYNAT